MRALGLLLVLSVIAGGCADFMAPRRVTFTAPGACGELARQRLEDAAMNDLAAGYEKAIFENSYRDCMATQAKYGP